MTESRIKNEVIFPSLQYNANCPTPPFAVLSAIIIRRSIILVFVSSLMNNPADEVLYSGRLLFVPLACKFVTPHPSFTMESDILMFACCPCRINAIPAPVDATLLVMINLCIITFKFTLLFLEYDATSTPPP